MDPATIGVYERDAGRWQSRRGPADLDAARALGRDAAAAVPGGPVVDLGCGPGWTGPALGVGGAPVIALDAARAMLDLVAGHHPAALPVQADLGRLPLRTGSLGGAWAAKSYVHLARAEVPLALHDLHRALAVGAPAELVVFAGDLEHGPFDGDDFPGRRFSLWPEPLLRTVLTGAGFAVEELVERTASDGGGRFHLRLRRLRTLADTVGPGMRLLVCGLNPSVYAADAGVGFARPGNRFWPAALAAGLVTRDRDPVHALRVDGVGMTDLVKRASPRADELTRAEYAEGVERLDRLVTWLQPGAVCLVGLAGWRAAVDRRATAGLQPDRLGGRPVHVMPSTSGVNARVSPAELTAHLRSALAAADR